MRRLGPSLSYDDATRILLEGVSGCNYAYIAREIGLSRHNVLSFMDKSVTTRDETRDKIAEFVWIKLNAHLLICDEDKK